MLCDVVADISQILENVQEIASFILTKTEVPQKKIEQMETLKETYAGRLKNSGKYKRKSCESHKYPMKRYFLRSPNKFKISEPRERTLNRK